MRKYDDLMVFVRVVECGSFIGAAKRLSLPPATVSRKIQELESRLRMQLLRRTTRSLSVTEAGQAVYEAARRGLEALEEAEAIVQARHDQPSGLLRISAPYAFGLLRLEPVLRAFQKAFPAVKVELLMTNEPVDIVAHDLDLAVQAGAIMDSPYVVRPLFRGGFVVVASPRYIERLGAPSSPQDLARLPVAVLTGPHFLARPSPAASHRTATFFRGAETDTVTLEPCIASNEPMFLISHALNDGGPALIYDVLCQDHIEKGELVVLLEDWSISATLELSLIYERKSTQDPKVRAFVDFIFEHIRKRDASRKP